MPSPSSPPTTCKGMTRPTRPRKARGVTVGLGDEVLDAPSPFQGLGHHDSNGLGYLVGDTGRPAYSLLRSEGWRRAKPLRHRSVRSWIPLLFLTVRKLGCSGTTWHSFILFWQQLTPDPGNMPNIGTLSGGRYCPSSAAGTGNTSSLPDALALLARAGVATRPASSTGRAASRAW